jgi:Uma2 family endonuclease
MVSTRLLTAEDLFRLGPDPPYELVKGELIEVSPQGRVHGRVLSNLDYLLNHEVRSNKSGEVLVGDVGFVLARNPDTVLAPDLAFVRTERLVDEGDGYLELAPDLAIDVVSPSNTSLEIARKIELYLAGGSSEVWVVRPRERDITIHRAEGEAVVYRESDSLKSEVLPTLDFSVNEIFAA